MVSFSKKKKKERESCVQNSIAKGISSFVKYNCEEENLLQKTQNFNSSKTEVESIRNLSACILAVFCIFQWNTNIIFIVFQMNLWVFLFLFVFVFVLCFLSVRKELLAGKRLSQKALCFSPWSWSGLASALWAAEQRTLNSFSSFTLPFMKSLPPTSRLIHLRTHPRAYHTPSTRLCSLLGVGHRGPSTRTTARYTYRKQNAQNLGNSGNTGLGASGQESVESN